MRVHMCVCACVFVVVVEHGKNGNGYVLNSIKEDLLLTYLVPDDRNVYKFVQNIMTPSV